MPGTTSCLKPTYFDVVYSINPWMDPAKPVDTPLAIAQWERLREVYLSLGHTVDTIDPVPGLPDMVFAANGATVVDGRALVARFRDAERIAEGPAYHDWLRDHGFPGLRTAAYVNEGEGDYLLAGDWLLAGTGFRSDPRSHDEAQEYFGRPVIGLTLVDPDYYHLDTALTVLDGRTIAYYPAAFSPGSRSVLERLFPNALLATPRRRRGLRAERGVGRIQRGPAAERDRAGRTAAGARVQPDRRGPLRAPQGGRQREVLHPGAAPGVLSRGRVPVDLTRGASRPRGCPRGCLASSRVCAGARPRRKRG